eukprot:snap_masked-scaffold_20-processed-gene-4.39-mRNA-1 protein AED:0.37 eAED:0.37 QI:0/-1/0/1/-1/1/1/0/83
MSGHGVVALPINQIFQFMKDRERVQIWLYENSTLRMEGIIRGFDEYMNIVLAEAVELDLKQKTNRQLGTTLLKGDSVTLIMKA